MHSRRVLRFDVLESRRLLAANVQVYTADGDLFVRGDNVEPASVAIGQTLNFIVVAGQNGTTINGTTAPVVIPATEVTDDVRVILLGSDNTLRINDLQAPDAINVLTGAGDDSVTIDGDTTVAGALLIRPGTGANTIQLSNATVAGDFALSAASGADDTVNIEGGTYTNTVLRLRDGANVVNLSGAMHATGNLVVQGGAGADTVTATDADGRTDVDGFVVLSLSQGVNTSTLDGVDVGVTLEVGGGDDADTLSARGITIGEDLLVNLRGGPNAVDFNGLNVGDDLSYVGGAEDNDVRFVGGAGDQIGGEVHVVLGAGGNRVKLESLGIGGNVVITSALFPDVDDDIVCIDNVTIGNRLYVLIGGGHSTIGIDHVTVAARLTLYVLESGGDIGVSDSSANRSEIITGPGNDRLLLDNFTATTALAVFSGEGDDEVFVEGSSLGTGLRIVAGGVHPENNTVSVHDVTAAAGLSIEGGNTLVLQDTDTMTGGISLGGESIFVNATAPMTVGGNLDIIAADTLLEESAPGNLNVTGDINVDSPRLTNNTTEPVITTASGPSNLAPADFDFSAQMADLIADIAAACG